MKKILLLILFLAQLVNLYANSKCIITMGYKVEIKEPYILKNNDGLYKELYTKAANDIGCELKIIRKSKKEILIDLENGKIDFYPGFTIGNDRSNWVYYISSGLPKGFVAITRNSIHELKDIKQIKKQNLRVLIETNSVNKLSKLNLKTIEKDNLSLKKATKLLLDKEADIFIYNKSQVDYYFKIYNTNGLRTHEKLFKNKSSLFLGFSKKSEFINLGINNKLDKNCIAYKFKKSLEILNNNGYTKRLYYKYFKEKPRKNILVLHSYHETSTWVRNIQKGIDDTIDNDNYIVNLYIENMDTKRFSSKQWYENLKQTYKLKYKDIKFDLIISSDNNAFNFLKKNREELFGNIPVVFCGVNFFKKSHLNGYTNYTGIAENEDFDASIKLMKKLNPNLKVVYITGDYLTSGKLVKEKIKRLIKKNNYGIKVQFSPNAIFSRMLTEISKLKKDSAILYGIYFKDSTGKYLSPEYTSREIVKNSHVPVYTMFDLFLKNGVLGGNMISSYSQGKMATKIANKILAGEKTKNIPVVLTGSNENIFDYKAMNKFNIIKEDLPKNSKIINKNINIYTKDELDWILTNPHVIVGGEMDWKPFDFVNKYGEYDGITNDVLNIISKKSGLKFKLKTNLSWEELLSEFKKGNIDVMPAIYHFGQREEFGTFTNPYINVQENIFVLDSTKFNKVNDLENATFAGVKGYSNIKQIKNKFPNIKIKYVQNTSAAINLLLKKEVDAFIGGKIVVEYILAQRKISNIRGISQNIINVQELRMLIKKDKNYLESIIKKSLKNISENEIIEIKKRWSDKKLFLTQEEKEWVKEHKELKIVIDPHFLPFSGFIDNSHNHGGLEKGFNGISIELLNKALSQVNISAKYIKTKSWSESLELVKNGKADLITTTAMTKKRKKFLRYTHTTTLAPRAIVVNEDTLDIHSIEDLKGKKVGLIKSGAIASRVMTSVLLGETILFDNIEEGLNSLKNKEIDAFVDSFFVLAYIIKEEGLNNLVIVNKFDENNKLYIAVNKSNISNIGINVINKALSSITKAQKSEIKKRWSNITVKEEIDFTLLLQIIGVFVLLILIGLYWTRKINIAKKEAQESKEYANSIMNSQENFVITTDGNKIRSANKAFLEFYKVRNIYEFMQKFGKCICDTFEVTTKKGYITKVMDNQTWLEYINSNPNEIHKTIIIKDNIEYIFKISIDEITFKNERLKTVVLSDITTMESITNEIRTIHNHTRDSIEYASLIQGALIPEEEMFKRFFKDHFVYWMPKDVVGGDIYLFESFRDENECILMCIDCTGHGVPGAFVTMLVKAIERQIIAKIEHDKYHDIDISPAWILSYFNKQMKQLLKQNSKDSKSNAGFDGGIIYYNKKEQIVKFSGAETPLFYFDENNEFKTIKGSRHSVGYKKCDIEYEYQEHMIRVKEGMKFYLTTDGYLDQNGGKKDFPFGKKRFTNIIQENYTKPMSEQKSIFINEMRKYENMIINNDRNDDITLIALEIDKNDEIILEYTGELNQKIITQQVQELENKIDNINLLAKISTIIIELLQNMMNYSKSNEEDDINIVPSGNLKIVKRANGTYQIKAINIVSNEDKNKIDKRLKEIQNLDEKSIKQKYKELRRSGKDKHSVGAGIGFYEIAKLSYNIEFRFEKINNKKQKFIQKYEVQKKLNK